MLEGKLRRDLQAPGASAAQERIANPDVSGSRQAIGAGGTPGRCETMRSRIGDESGQIRVGEIRAVEQVIGLEAQLHNQAFG